MSMVYQKIQQQADAVAAGIVVTAMGQQGFEQLFGSLLGVIPEGFIVDGGIIQQLLQHRLVLRRLAQQPTGLLRGNHAAHALLCEP